MRTLLAVPNVSEGRDAAALAAIGDAFAHAGARVLHSSRDADHHRAVFTLAGAPGALAEAVTAGAIVAAERIDVRAHAGEHPRVGAVDVAPIVHLRREDRGAACAEALVLADLLGDRARCAGAALRRAGRGTHARRPAPRRPGGARGAHRLRRARPRRRPAHAAPACRGGARRRAGAAGRVQRAARPAGDARRRARGGGGDPRGRRRAACPASGRSACGPAARRCRPTWRTSSTCGSPRSSRRSPRALRVAGAELVAPVPRPRSRAGRPASRSTTPRRSRRSSPAFDRRSHWAGPSGDRLLPAPASGRLRRGLRERLARIASEIAAGVAHPLAGYGDDVDAWDPEYIAATLPDADAADPGATSAPRCTGSSRSPDGPSLLVGNHSGGRLIVDTFLFTYAFYEHFGPDRRFHQLAHDLVARDARRSTTLAPLRDVAGVARERPARVRARRAGARLPRRRRRDLPPVAGARPRSTSPAAAGSGSRSRRASRSSPSSRSAARRPRCSSPAAGASRRR